MKNPSDFCTDEAARISDELEIIVVRLDEDMTGGGPADKGSSEDEEDRIVSRGEEDGGGGAEKDGGETLGDKGPV